MVRKRILGIFLVLALVMSFIPLISPQSALASAPWDPSMPLPERKLTEAELNAWKGHYKQYGISPMELEILRLTNIERGNAGLPPLGINLDLFMVARFKSQDCLDLRYFSHDSPVYGGPSEMVGFVLNTSQSVGENLSATGGGNPRETAARIVSRWMSSPGHRANILHSSYRSMGVGYAWDFSDLSMTGPRFNQIATQVFSMQAVNDPAPVWDGLRFWPSENNTSYLFKTGVMQFGWQIIDSNMYYFDITGRLVENNAINQFTARLYWFVLGRLPDAGGLQFWANWLRSGEMTGAAAAYEFVFSSEFINKGLSDSEYVDTLYVAFMGRGADPDGKAYWMGLLNAGLPRVDVFAGFANSAEFEHLCNVAGIRRGMHAPPPGGYAQMFIKRLYLTTLERPADPGGVAFWQGLAVDGMTGAAMAYEFVFSGEMDRRNLSNTEYIEILYNSMMGRVSDPGGMAFWLDMMERQGASRYSVFANFVMSGEFEVICSRHGLLRGTPP